MSRIKQFLLKITKASILTALPLALLFIGAFVTMLITIRGREVVVPNLAGIEKEVALDLLKKNRLGGMITGTRFSSDFPAGQVIQQMPEAGSRVKVGKQVKLVLSEGRKQVEVPRLVGLTLREAQAVLGQVGLRIGLISRAALLASPREQIVEQIPVAGERNIATPYVNLLVNVPSGDFNYVMPDFRGLEAHDVSSFLNRNGFLLRPTEHEVSFTQRPGLILMHYPEPGYPFSRSSPITLVVSR
ncbi:MAG TPA: PASTA domain-containing protein [Acidobacteriota bacterium]|nr:PASTA domain-containing protein [Acidobacteriota bacterium]HQM62598.1 PASTA domain-containing protein [Acidobacteriota bacterium]